MRDTMSENMKMVGIVSGVTVTGIALVAAAMYVMPLYNIWQQRLTGEAELARASMNRQIAVQEAEAKRAAAKELAQAEIERARGVAEANRIIGDSLQNNEDYLRYLFVNNLEHTQNQVIYIPTEANLPILEANRNKR